MTNGSGPDHYDDRKTVDGKKPNKRPKKAAVDAAKQQSATKRAQ